MESSWWTSFFEQSQKCLKKFWSEQNRHAGPALASGPRTTGMKIRLSRYSREVTVQTRRVYVSHDERAMRARDSLPASPRFPDHAS